MKPVVELSGVVLAAPIAAAFVALAVGSLAVAGGVCDPKLGCSFGVQFGALLSALAGLLLGLLLLCGFAILTAATGRVLPARVTWGVAALVGIIVGAALSIFSWASYL